MKKTLIFLALTVCVFLSSCGDDAWDYDHSLEHVYFYGLCNEAYPGGNEKVYTVAQGSTVEVPTQFWSSFTRSCMRNRLCGGRRERQHTDSRCQRGLCHDLAQRRGRHPERLHQSIERTDRFHPCPDLRPHEDDEQHGRGEHRHCTHR